MRGRVILGRLSGLPPSTAMDERFLNMDMDLMDGRMSADGHKGAKFKHINIEMFDISLKLCYTLIVVGLDACSLHNTRLSIIVVQY